MSKTVTVQESFALFFNVSVHMHGHSENIRSKNDEYINYFLC